MTERRTLKTPGCEQLKGWLADEKLLYQDLAVMLGVAEVTIRGWARGAFRPDREHMATLEAISAGAVPASSWADTAEVEARVGIACERRALLESNTTAPGKESP
jgi:hypothetical protein